MSMKALRPVQQIQGKVSRTHRKISKRHIKGGGRDRQGPDYPGPCRLCKALLLKQEQSMKIFKCVTQFTPSNLK